MEKVKSEELRLYGKSEELFPKQKNNQQSASGTLDSPPTASSDISSLDSMQKTIESCFTNSAVIKA